MRKILFLLGVVFLFGGCASNLVMKDFRSMNYSDDQAAAVSNLLIEPIDSIGLKVTPAIRSGDYVTYEGIFPEIIYSGEFFPGRLKWYGLAVDEKTGQEYLVQALFIFKGFYDGQGVYFITGLFIDGSPNPATTKVRIYSTRLNYGYDLLFQKEKEVNRSKLLGEAKFRQDDIVQNGTLLSKLRAAPKLKNLVAKWNLYSSSRGDILSPLGEKEMREINDINPSYGFGQKLIAKTRGTVSDPISTGMSWIFDSIRAARAPSTGWDFNSELPSRRNMAFIAMHIADLKQKIVENAMNNYVNTAARSAP